MRVRLPALQSQAAWFSAPDVSAFGVFVVESARSDKNPPHFPTSPQSPAGILFTSSTKFYCEVLL
jgi:hypothetical protein